jgi:hypothetical protein
MRVPTDQTGHHTAYGWCDAEEMGDSVCVQKFILSNKKSGKVVRIVRNDCDRPELFSV